MKLLMRYRYLAMAAALLGAVACSGSSDDPVDPQPAPGELQKLTLTADKESIDANGSDILHFTALYGEEDVTNSKNLVVSYRIDGGEEVRLTAGVGVFATRTAGTYVFNATYKVDEENTVTAENTVSVVANEVEIKLDEYVRRVLGIQFTSIGCVNCPPMSTFMKEIREDFGDQVAVASFHTDYNNVDDPMAIAATQSLISKFKIGGLPHFVLDMDPALESNANKGKISQLISERLQNDPRCGVAISSNYNASNGKLTVDAYFTANEEIVVRYIMLVVEDGINYYQMGLEGDEGRNYIHNNVVRAMMTQNYNGEAMNGGDPFIPGVEVSATRAITLDGSWNAENMRIIVAAMTSEDGRIYSCENVAECRIGEEVYYNIR